ncbi:GPI mannosyltransferase 4-like [Penaeus japonicus]|uniref:GPI mannosyltransferase 4-like n=1 Tax=Penaeus japonicus TaxID=27405 RepID=UPI001C70F77D|nr:GPI mannosyltransferase 4-like [Penaeus japonicus]
MECRKRSRTRASAYEGFKSAERRALKPAKISDSSIFWWMLAAARLYLATVQTGYIHPDEFHQSLQVMARDVLDIDALKPWEFHTSTPIRSVAFSAIVSVPYVVIRYATAVASYFDFEILTPRVLLLAPRIYMTLLSFIADFCIYRIARMCYIRPWQCVEVFASSYIMLVYATRTFSNSLELILIAILYWRVCESMVESGKVMKQENILKDLYETADTMQEKVKLMRMKSKLPPYNYVDSAIISAVVTLGVFIRPTFLAFSFVPVAYWLQRGVVTKELDFSYFHLRCMSLLPGVVTVFLMCMLADSFYYGSLTFTELLYWNVTSNSFTVTPINFLMYNMKEENLATHGLHPHYLHLVVNVPILHGVLGVLGLWSVSKYAANFCLNTISKKPKVYSVATMLLLSFIFPVMALSLIPHQEPRFLLPTLIPLVILHADDIFLYSPSKRRLTKHFIFAMWHVWNIFCVIVFGFLHQGGVTKTMFQVHEHILERPAHTNMHIVFSNMYTPPTFLLLRRVNVIAKTDEGRKYRIAKSVFTYNAGGSRSVDDLHEIAAEVYSEAITNSTKAADVLLCLPASLTQELFRSKPENVSLIRLQRVRGHLTLEDPPDLSLNGANFTRSCGQLCQFLDRLDQFSIDIIRMKFDPDFVRPVKQLPKDLTMDIDTTELDEEEAHKEEEEEDMEEDEEAEAEAEMEAEEEGDEEDFYEFEEEEDEWPL